MNAALNHYTLTLPAEIQERNIFIKVLFSFDKEKKNGSLLMKVFLYTAVLGQWAGLSKNHSTPLMAIPVFRVSDMVMLIGGGG